MDFGHYFSVDYSGVAVNKNILNGLIFLK